MRNLFTVNRFLWIVQSLLALFFIGASGAPKLALPADALPMPIPLPQAFVWFIGTCEVLGGLGLLIPRLTALSASCLTLLTICAATYQLMGGQPYNAVFALAIGALAGLIAYARMRPTNAEQTSRAAAAVTGP
jgi:uncharacterized membrane protein YphA (DoxX/SURF4 family)